MKFRYKIELADGTVINGERELMPGINRIVEALPKGTLKSVSGTLPLVIGEDEKIFMNGYQTWTFCPELNKSSSIRPMAKLPKALINHYGIDRYGDYHFVNYPNRRGVTHGESYCYFRLKERFRLFASLDEVPGYTMFMYDSRSSLLTVSRDCEGVSCGGDCHAFDLFIAEGEENEVFDAWFTAMGIKPRTDERIAGYSSWYNRYQKISEMSIMDDLNGCSSVMREGDLFQIDDGWEPFVGDWLEPDGKKIPAWNESRCRRDTFARLQGGAVACAVCRAERLRAYAPSPGLAPLCGRRALAGRLKLGRLLLARYRQSGGRRLSAPLFRPGAERLGL